MLVESENERWFLKKILMNIKLSLDYISNLK